MLQSILLFLHTNIPSRASTERTMNSFGDAECYKEGNMFSWKLYMPSLPRPPPPTHTDYARKRLTGLSFVPSCEPFQKKGAEPQP